MAADLEDMCERQVGKVAGVGCEQEHRFDACDRCNDVGMQQNGALLQTRGNAKNSTDEKEEQQSKGSAVAHFS